MALFADGFLTLEQVLPALLFIGRFRAAGPEFPPPACVSHWPGLRSRGRTQAAFSRFHFSLTK